MSELVELTEANFGKEKMEEFDKWMSTHKPGVTPEPEEPQKRFGIFFIEEGFWREHPLVVAEIWKSVTMVIRAELMTLAQPPRWMYLATSDLMDLHPVTQPPPVYEVKLKGDGDGNVEVAFMKRTEEVPS